MSMARITNLEARRLGILSTPKIKCARCTTSTPRRHPMQKYCEPCSRARDLERKRKWAGDNPRSSEHLRNIRSHKDACERERGMRLSECAPMAWPAESDPSLAWIVRVAVPFSYKASKNHLWSLARQGHVMLRREHRRARDDLTIMLRSAMGDTRAVPGKVWLDIMVEKPNHRGDAVNVVDMVCDAVKEAIGIDDRWFSIRRLDWIISKRSPRLIVGVGQETREHSGVCSYCGRILPVAYFLKSKSRAQGHGRICLDCRRDPGRKP